MLELQDFDLKLLLPVLRAGEAALVRRTPRRQATRSVPSKAIELEAEAPETVKVASNTSFKRVDSPGGNRDSAIS